VVVVAAMAPASVAGAQRAGDARVAVSEARSAAFAPPPPAIERADTTPRPRYSPADLFTARPTLGAIGMALGTLGGFLVARTICDPRVSDGETCDHVPTLGLALSGAALRSALGVTTGAHRSGGRRVWGHTLGRAATAAGLAAVYRMWRSSGSAGDRAEFSAFILGTPATVIGAMVGNYAGE